MPQTARIPVEGIVWHYRPVEFMNWINDITWTSEWSKYRIAGARPPKPRNRRV